MSVTFLACVNGATANAAGAISGSSDPVTFSVGAGEGAQFPAANFPISVDSEIMLCTSRTNDALTCARAQEGTIKAAHALGATVRQNITAAMLTEIQTAINNIIAGTTTLDAVTVTGATALNGTVGLGNASTDVITCNGRMVFRKITDRDNDAGTEDEAALWWNSGETRYVWVIYHGATTPPWVLAG